MIKCHNCGTGNLDTSQFCDECGTKLVRFQQDAARAPLYVPPVTETPAPVAIIPEPPVQAQVTSIGIPPLNAAIEQVADVRISQAGPGGGMNETLIIERSDGPGTEFRIVGTESIIGRWDADNGVFPDVDLDSHDSEAKVSRRHARIRLQDSHYMIEDLGSTNGTYVNRGRRLLPGMAQVINDGDEVIVGKTFLRFRIAN